MKRFKPNIFLVFEFCEHDLAGLLKNKDVEFTPNEKKKIAQQLLTGLHYIHKNKVNFTAFTVNTYRSLLLCQ